MAMYHLRAKIHSRSAGKSAVACAAYRAGERLVDERCGQTQDYTKKKGVIESGIEAPECAAAWATDRGKLWNQVEATETRKNSRLAREFEVSLPHELTAAARKELVQGFIREELVKRGMVADWSIHKPNREGDQRAYHVHIMTTTRAIGPDGFEKKVREWDKRDTLCAIREAWANHTNKALEKAGIESRIDHRTLAAQGIDREPVMTKGVKLTNMERRGKWSAAAKEILDRKTQEQNKALIRKERKNIEQEIRWKEYEGRALDLTTLALSDPNRISEARNYITKTKEAIVEEIAAEFTPAYQKERAKAEKAYAAAAKMRDVWEKQTPFPTPEKRILENNQHYMARIDRERDSWNKARAPYLEAEDKASRVVQEYDRERRPDYVASRYFNTNEQFRTFTDLQLTLSHIDRENARTRDRGREGPDLGR